MLKSGAMETLIVLMENQILVVLKVHQGIECPVDMCVHVCVFITIPNSRVE